MAKVRIQDASVIAERDDIGKCKTCSDLALDGEKYCISCKDYWENDAPKLAEQWDDDDFFDQPIELEERV